ncbi:IS5 family transposase [Blastococcus sp. BMG 814]|uniref:IS5 family transposase n=1 Tax=Blastococcus carthaginiensis TaxID=3050034 RepID=A0ABT9IIV4_9ACTN|nr:IS5 family transposase [Blastococcus carthaginiensis]MDP5185099.1 IS5 family transposase [Blastococcus carthaginiensis]MDP5185509.1 IS5 family transposase [Blastococcus carthaginiensis]MDP5185519.1 IS5 family transposase [Blastococcus carthaginiensis]
MPAVPSCILDPLREEFLTLLPVRVDEHPLGCHRPRIDDAVVFGKLVEALVFGAGYERIADDSCSATTMRRRRDEWIALGVFDRLRLACLDAYDKMIGLDLADVAVDGCTTKAPCGGECAGRSPVDRGKGGLKRSQLTDGGGIPLATVSAPANTVDHALLPQTLDALKDFQPLPAGATAHLDAGYDYRPCREALDERGLLGQIAHRGEPAPIQVGKRWVVERTNSWLNNFGKLRRCTERRQVCVDAYLALAAAIVTVRALCRGAWRLYRWDTRPRSPRIR